MEPQVPVVDGRPIEPGAERGPNLVGALAAGLGAAVVAALAWYLVVVLTRVQFGLLAVGVGFLVGTGVLFGAGGRRGVALQAMSVVITLLAMCVSEYLIDRHFAVAELAKEGPVDVPLVLPFTVMASVVAEGLKSDPLTLLFWGIALWTAFKLPAPQTA